jgi:N-acetylmuramoyl-L-alanine amidase
VRFYCLFPGLLGIVGSLLLSMSVEAATLQSWRFSQGENRLVFTTNGDVQPRAQLIANPTRLVIDLPGTTFGRPMMTQPGEGGIREVRVGQFDAQTTRIVVELVEGYTLDPQQVQVRGATPTQWTVQLPTPQRDPAYTPPIASPPPSNLPSNSPANPTVTGAATQLEALQITPDGFFVRTRGATPRLEVDRSRDRRQITIDLQDTAVSPQLTLTEQSARRFGVDQIRITQEQTSPPVARITLNLSNPNIEWRATASNLGGIVILPTGGVEGGSIAQEQPQPPVTPVPRQPATIQAVELEGTQLVVRADQPLTYTNGWDRSTAAYRIAIPNARLADQVRPPTLLSNSPLLRVRLQQQDEQTVVILVSPAARVQIGEINQPNRQTLALYLQTSSQTVPVPPPVRPSPIPVIPPDSTVPPGSLPTIPDGRIVIVVDPGHGGSDPGAIGIGGAREKDITLAVARQVTALLQQQGIRAVLTRSDDRDLELQPRVDIAERADADLFVSIHVNSISLSRPEVNGAEVYYYDSGQALAQTLQNTIVRETGMFDRGARSARFYVLRNTSMPSVLIEMGFITGRDDQPRLTNPAFQSRMATSIVRGILQYVQQNFR